MSRTKRSKATAITLATFLAGIISSPAVTIDTVYFAQTHLLEVSHPYFNLGGNRETLIKAHVVAPGGVAAPSVQAVLTLDGNTLNLPLTGPAILPESIPNGPGVVQHSFANTFTGVIPKAWVKRGLSISIQAGAATANFNNMVIGAPTRVIMTMLDVHYFSQASGDYPAGWREEIEAKWPVAELEVRRLPNVVFPELVVPPRSDVGAPAVRVKSQSDYSAQTGLGFDGEQAAALAWNGALKRAAGTSGRVSLYYTNIYGVPAGGQAGGFAGVGTGTGVGILHHELGHALSLPHWANSSAYPYKGEMHGIPTPVGNPVHAGPTWAYDSRFQTFIPCTTQPNNVTGKPVGTYKVDPMQGGGMGYQEPPFLLNHFSDYSMRQMRNYLDGHVLVWNESLGRYASWSTTTRAYTNSVTNNGVQYPLERDVPVISVMASISGAKPDVCMVYPPIGPYTTGLIRLFDPTVAADRTAAASIYAPANGCDVSVRVTQGGVVKTYMLAAAWEPTQNLLSSASLRTAAVNLPAADGPITRIDLLYSPDAQINGLPANPEVLHTWAPLMPDPAGFATLPLAGNSSSITMTATTGISEEGPVEYLFTETSGNPGGSSSAWQSSPIFTDVGLQPSTTYTYTVTLRAGDHTGRASAPASATTATAGIPGTITFDKFVSAYIGSTPKTFTFDASASDKLVVIVTGEHNFGGNLTGNVKTITYDGVSLIKAVEQDPVSSTLQTTSELWYLDDPGSVHAAGQIVISVEGNGNNYVHAAIGLSGTAPGFGGASMIAIGMPTANMNVSAPNSMVISWLTLGGSGNTAGTATSIQSGSPVSAIPFGEVATSGNYAGHVLARSSGLTPGMNTFSFNTALTDVLCLAAEFLAAEFPASPYQIWSAHYPAANLTDSGADFDGGGLANCIEWVLGGDPTDGGDDAGLAPTIDNTSDPDFFIYHFNRANAANDDPDTTITVEYGSNLSAWTTAVDDSNSVIITETPGTPADAVEVKILRTLATDGKLFARLRVVVDSAPN